jgi:leucyl aminopeptidase
MIDLPDFKPLKVTCSSRALTRSSLDALDHVLIVVAKSSTAALKKMPQGAQLAKLLERAVKRGEEFATSRASNARATGLTVTAFSSTTAFAALTSARKVIAECLRDKPATIGLVLVGLEHDDEVAAAQNLTAAAHAAAFELPTFKSHDALRGARLRTLRIFATVQRADLAGADAQAGGNNVARWLTALPPNVLCAGCA